MESLGISKCMYFSCVHLLMKCSITLCKGANAVLRGRMQEPYKDRAPSSEDMWIYLKVLLELQGSL